MSSSRNETVGPFHATVRLGRVAGISLGINWSWFIVFGLIIWSLADNVFPTSYPGLAGQTYLVMAVVGAFLFFVGLVAHEFGHAIVAKREGMEISGITLWVFGGVASFKGMFPSATAEFRIAIAGPIVSLVIGLFALAVAGLTDISRPVEGVIAWLGWINIIVLLFNMLPALPLDGGRVLRSMIWRFSGDFTRSTRIAGGVGKVFGQVMIIGGIMTTILLLSPSGLWLALIGWFLYMAASAEMSLATASALLKGLRVADAMITHPVTVNASLTLGQFLEDVFPRNRHAAYPVTDNDGTAVGLIPFQLVARIPRKEWNSHRIEDCMIALEDALVFSPEAELGQAAIELAQNRFGRALVVDDGRMVGLLSMTDISRLLELRRH